MVDASAVDLATVLVSAGRRGLEIGPPPAGLLRLTGTRTAAIVR